MKVLSTQSNGQFPRIVAIIFGGLKIIGLAPFTFQRIKKSPRNPRDGCYTGAFLSSKMELAYNISLSILILVLGAVAIQRLPSIIHQYGSFMTQAIVMIEVISSFSVSCVIIAVEALRQKKAISIMNKLLRVDFLLSGMTRHPRSQRTSLIFLTVHIIFNALLWVTSWATQFPYIVTFLHGFIFNIPIFVIYWFIVKYSIVLAFITVELESLNKILSDFEEFPNYSFHTPVLHDYNPSVLGSLTHCSQLATLKKLRDIRTTLSEVSVDVEEFFSIPILFSVACSSVAFFSAIYYFFIPTILSVGETNVYYAISAVASIAICFYPLVFLTSNVTKTLKEAKLTARIVHNVLAKTKRPEIQKQLERFSLQLTHENLSFTAHGFFSLDFTLIQSILGTTATYLVIIIQFMLSTDKIPGHTKSLDSGTNI